MSTSAEVSGKSQAELIYELQQRQRVRFNLGVNISWVILLSVLLFFFSGIQLKFLGITIKTIELDMELFCLCGYTYSFFYYPFCLSRWPQFWRYWALWAVYPNSPRPMPWLLFTFLSSEGRLCCCKSSFSSWRCPNWVSV